MSKSEGGGIDGASAEGGGSGVSRRGKNAKFGFGRRECGLVGVVLLVGANRGDIDCEGALEGLGE